MCKGIKGGIMIIFPLLVGLIGMVVSAVNKNIYTLIMCGAVSIISMMNILYAELILIREAIL